MKYSIMHPLQVRPIILPTVLGHCVGTGLCHPVHSDITQRTKLFRPPPDFCFPGVGASPVMPIDGPVLSEYITVYVVLLLSAETNPQYGYG